MNVPNKLTVLRLILVPVFFIGYQIRSLGFASASVISTIIMVVCYAIAELSDLLDGKIARKYNLITNFGKFIDPLADKFMVFAALLTVCYAYDYIAPFFIWVAVVIMFRELGVTSLRLVVSGNAGIVVAASLLGKLKTVSQMVGLLLIILEPLVIPTLFQSGIYLLSYIMAGIMTVTA